nr:MAG TPA: hypothetical protein [Caudoviricetes sp.]
MRLIDADKIIDSLGNSDMDFAIGAVIDEQPTVFDVDKISKELVKQKKIANKKMNESDDTYSMSYYDGFSSGIAIAIGIVKGGGVE